MSLNNVKEGDAFLCTVTRIESVAVFVNIDELNTEGTIVYSEISAGRIRNIREFVSVGKKIVCKILRKKDSHIELSLRRVTASERDGIMDKYKKERILSSILKPILKETTSEIVEKIKKENDIPEIIDNLRNNPQSLKEYLTPSQMDILKKQLSEKKEKEKEVKRKISLKSDSESGITDIKSILDTNEADVSYLGSSHFLITVKAKEYKQANSQLEKIIASIKEKSKAHKAQLEIK